MSPLSNKSKSEQDIGRTAACMLSTPTGHAQQSAAQAHMPMGKVVKEGKGKGNQAGCSLGGVDMGSGGACGA